MPKKIVVGVAIGTSVKPNRDLLLALERVVLERDSKVEKLKG